MNLKKMIRDWLFGKDSMREQLRILLENDYLIQKTIKSRVEVALLEVANDHSSLWFDARFRAHLNALKEQLETNVPKEVNKIVGDEKFIDEIINRIKNKQL